MSFTNINDAEGVKALLEQLRSSQAWVQATATPPCNPPPVSEPSVPSDVSSGGSVAALLSQLQSSQDWPAAPAVTIPNPPHGRSQSVPPIRQEASEGEHRDEAPPSQPIPSAPSIPRKQDVKSLNFQQALPYLAQLAGDPSFVTVVTQLKKEQDDLERRLWEDRRGIFRKYEEKVKVAKTKGTMIGSGVSKHEADLLEAGLKKELQKFDLERVLPAWDGMVQKQQGTFAQLGVPTMFPTQSTSDRERQQRVVQVLEGLVKDE